MDAYFHFYEPGDHYLGSVLCVMDPNVSESNTLLNKDIISVMDLMYGKILLKWRGTNVDPSSVLINC